VRTKRSTVPHKIIVNDDAQFLTAGQICERYIVSPMWISRRLASDPTFPKPLCFGTGTRTRRWRLRELEKWEATWQAWPEVQAQKRAEHTVQP
jgi:predicted DNA-binding transcriptional regulator AlpA